MLDGLNHGLCGHLDDVVLLPGPNVLTRLYSRLQTRRLVDQQLQIGVGLRQLSVKVHRAWDNTGLTTLNLNNFLDIKMGCQKKNIWW
ncbi:hypothetical protein DPMN_056995 [Dreissena polymorpha]|uniref:Uncharacterized protein n=1 Tax=Dreissena polymorpha TaxID=45954 RepID=A0A9D4HU12_DREPO|nr:hypothetical protein DPMN_056995 [Dreissena polymorpha]